MHATHFKTEGKTVQKTLRVNEAWEFIIHSIAIGTMQ